MLTLSTCRRKLDVMARPTPAKPARKRADQYHHGDLRRALLQAAVRTIHSRGIDGLTLRAVAARARLSHGSVLFHFKRKDQLGLALLDRVLATTLPPGLLDVVEALPDPRERLPALFRQEVARLAAEPRPVRLLLEYWSRGAHNAMIRKKILAALEAYRAAFGRLAEEALRGKADLGAPRHPLQLLPQR